MDWVTWRDENKRKWEARVPIHVGPRGYERSNYLNNPEHISDVVRFDRKRINGGKPISSFDVCHLQCHIGTDTLSHLRLGARSVTGLDFSPSSLAEAKWLFQQVNAQGTFVESDVFDAASALNASYDLVYASVGAINWINDIARWMQVAANLLRPGGYLYLRDIHPVAMMIDPDRKAGDPLSLRFDYFETEQPGTTIDDTTYTGDDTKLPEAMPNHEWSHGVAEIVGGVLRAGLRLDALFEDEFADWQAQPDMVRDTTTGHYHLPSNFPRIPWYLTVMATKPAG